MSKDRWIQDAVKSGKGKLRKALNVKEGEKIPHKKLEQAKNSSSPKLRKEAQLAETLSKFKKVRK